jgi:DNA-binding MarR family transcriptional regulator
VTKVAAAPGWDRIGALMEGLAYAQRPIHAAARAITKQLGLGPRGAFILNLLSQGCEYPHELASKLSTSRSLVTSDLNRLIDAGLVAAISSDSDKRMTRLHLTAAGAKICADIRGEMARIVQRNLARYSDAELSLFTDMLTAVRALEPDELPRP